jgi:hypothetical protein
MPAYISSFTEHRNGANSDLERAPMSLSFKVGLTIALVAAASVALWYFCIPPEHWLRQVRTFASVTVNDRPVQANIYIGHPTNREAEAFLLVDIGSVGNYLFNFEDETLRELPGKEFLRLGGRVFAFRPISTGNWVQPLPSTNINEFRVGASNGSIVTVRF